MEHFLIITDIIGIISFSISGFIIAIYYKFDLVGIFISSILTALGGGIIRDGMIGKMPFLSRSNPSSVGTHTRTKSTTKIDS